MSGAIKCGELQKTDPLEPSGTCAGPLGCAAGALGST
jgi:hypothetical protein